MILGTVWLLVPERTALKPSTTSSFHLELTAI